jgi:hypothetical protein
MSSIAKGFAASAALALGVAASPASATVLSDFLTFDGPLHLTDPVQQGGGEDKLQDDSLSVFDDRGTTGYSVGDVIYGQVTLSDLLASGRASVPVGANSQISILFSATITGFTATGEVILGATAAADPLSLQSLLVDGAMTSGMTAQSIGVILSTTTPDTNAADDPLNWTTAQFNTDYSTANNWNQEVVFGLVDSDDFFQFDPTGALLIGTDLGAFTIQQSAFNATWLPVDVQNYDGTTHLGSITLNIGNVSLASAEQNGRGWFFTDQSTFYVNPTAVPEPGTLALVSGALLGFGALRGRSKKS